MFKRFFILIIFALLLLFVGNSTAQAQSKVSCGSHHQKNFFYTTTNWPNGTFCSPNSNPVPGSPAYPQPGGARTWSCVEKDFEEDDDDDDDDDEKKKPAIAYCWATRMPGPDSDEWWNDSCGNLNGMCGTLHRRVFPHTTTTWPSGADGRFCSGDQMIEPANPLFPAAGKVTPWKCSNKQMRFYVNCWAARDYSPPTCGSLHTQKFSHEAENWPSGSFCGIGTAVPTIPAFPSPGITRSWRCVNGEQSVNCWASKADMPTPPPPEPPPEDEYSVSYELGYDVVRAYFIVDGEIDVAFVDKDKEVRDGLKIVGGLFATGRNPSIRLGRSLQLRDNLMFPSVLVFHDSRYLDISKRVFGNTFGGGYVRDVGFKE